MTVTAAHPPRQRTRALARSMVTAALVVGIDQLTKHTVAAGIAPGEQRHLLPGITLVHVRNSGVAFSILSGGGPLVLVVTLVALGLLITYLLMRPSRRLLWLPTGLLVGGALGNLIDRISTGAVTDFIKLPDWPAFNVADMCITFGVIALVLVLELGGRRDAR
jgi:signal peptidase II